MEPTAKLQLQRITDAGLFDDYLRLKSDPEAIKWSGFATAPDAVKLKNHFENLVKSDRKIFFLKDNSETVGYCQISLSDEGRYEIDGYSILSDFVGKGYGSRMIDAVIRELDREKPREVVAWVSEKNISSLRCLEKCGFSQLPGEEKFVELKALGRSDRFVPMCRRSGSIKPKVCIVTAARSEYGLLQWLITDLERDPDIELSLIVTGSHLSTEQGMTYRQIEADGHKITRRVEYLLEDRSAWGASKSAGICGDRFADVLNEEKPDVLVVLGDRYELLPICTAALIQNIPIAHISGGDVTEGAIDNQIRNAVTMMAAIHFPGTAESASNIARMRGSGAGIHNVGEPGLETFRRTELLTRSELAESLGIDETKKWVVCTLHPETMESTAYNLAMARNMVEAISGMENCEVIITAANADPGGGEMNEYFRTVCERQPNFHFIHSLGQHRYLSMMNQLNALIGNTSSGLVEAPFTGVPVINIGDRQKGRHLCRNVVPVRGDSPEELKQAISQIPDKKFEPDYYYGDGDTSRKIVAGLKKFLASWKKR